MKVIPLSAGLGAKVTVAGSPVNNPGPETEVSRVMVRCLRFTELYDPAFSAQNRADRPMIIVNCGVCRKSDG
jgi:hypothetical protein